MTQQRGAQGRGCSHSFKNTLHEKNNYQIKFPITAVSPPTPLTPLPPPPVSGSVPPARTYVVGGLRAGAAYELRVTSHNAAGATHAVYAVTTQPDGLHKHADGGEGGILISCELY